MNNQLKSLSELWEPYEASRKKVPAPSAQSILVDRFIKSFCMGIEPWDEERKAYEEFMEDAAILLRLYNHGRNH